MELFYCPWSSSIFNHNKDMKRLPNKFRIYNPLISWFTKKFLKLTEFMRRKSKNKLKRFIESNNNRMPEEIKSYTIKWTIWAIYLKVTKSKYLNRKLNQGSCLLTNNFQPKTKAWVSWVRTWKNGKGLRVIINS